MKRKKQSVFPVFNWEAVTFSLWDRIRLSFSPMQMFQDKQAGINLYFKTTKAGKVYIYSIKKSVGGR